MKKQDISILGKEDAFKLIGNEWMLVTASSSRKRLGSTSGEGHQGNPN